MWHDVLHQHRSPEPTTTRTGFDTQFYCGSFGVCLDFSLSDRLYLAVSPTVTGAFEIASKVSSTSVLSFLLLPLSVRLRESERVVPIYWPKILRRGSHHGLTTAEAK